MQLDPWFNALPAVQNGWSLSAYLILLAVSVWLSERRH